LGSVGPESPSAHLENHCARPVDDKNCPINTDSHSAETKTGLSILIVEDNELNQQLAITLLNNWGHTVEVANNGVEALELHQNGKYDLILMDMQMPVMGGTTATIKIREREENGHDHVTIIAMTASVLEGDREECLSIGMDDYLSKPFKVENLQSIIKKYSKVLHTRKKPSPGAAKCPTPATNEYFNYALALTEADTQIIALIARSFLAELPRQIATMRHAWQQQNFEVLQREAHTLSGLLGTFNAKPAQQIAIDIDRSVRNHDIANVPDLLTRLEHEADLFSIELGTFIV